MFSSDQGRESEKYITKAYLETKEISEINDNIIQFSKMHVCATFKCFGATDHYKVKK